MARKGTARKKKKPHAHGINDLTGILVTAICLLLLVALYSYDPRDLHSNAIPANEVPTNWMGLFGARLAFGIFFCFGGASYLVPLIGIGFGLSRLFASMDYLRRHWLAALLLVVASAGFLSLHDSFFSVFRTNLNIPSAGGLMGQLLNKFFGFFGKFGATAIYLLMYFYAVAALTDYQLFVWIRQWWAAYSAARRDAHRAEEAAVAERRRAAVSKPAREEESTEPRPRIGADLLPIPEPTIRDMSVSQFSPLTPAGATQEAGTEGEEGTAETVGEAEEHSDETEQETSEAEFSEEETLPEEAEEKQRPAPARPRPKPIRVAEVPSIGDYRLPELEYLSYPEPSTRLSDSREDLMGNARLMQNTLAQFGIEVNLGDITKGPTITRYELHPAPGIKLEKIANLTNNIAAALKAERINILAPVPGKSSVGIEVPNRIKTTVIMRDIMESEEWRKSRTKIPLALGKDVYGQPIIADLAEMPHLLIAGATGSGKSVCINSIVASLLYRFRPDELRFVMIDPKVVELQQYNHLPHLVVPVVTDPKKVVLALRWVVNEMEKRYQIFAKVGVRNIDAFNRRAKDEPPPQQEPELPLTTTRENVEASSEGFAVELDEEIVVPREEDIIVPDSLSYVVVVIDELADLMLVAPSDVEMAIARITQMARAAGIHCILATQRPSVDVITGVIKANIPARIAFQVASKVDSRTILDAMGADKLLGKGDMLYLPPGSARLIRAQGVFITDKEIQNIVDAITSQGKPSYEMEIHEQLQKPVSKYDSNGACDEDEDLIQQCIEVIRSEQKASVSLMQRRLRLGYTRAARIMDELENRGIVGPSRGAEPREILLDLDGTGADGGGEHAV